MPVLIHDQVAALEVAVHDGRAVGVQVEHSARRLGAAGQIKKKARFICWGAGWYSLKALRNAWEYVPHVLRVISVWTDFRAGDGRSPLTRNRTFAAVGGGTRIGVFPARADLNR